MLRGFEQATWGGEMLDEQNHMLLKIMKIMVWNSWFIHEAGNFPWRKKELKLVLSHRQQQARRLQDSTTMAYIVKGKGKGKKV